MEEEYNDFEISYIKYFKMGGFMISVQNVTNNFRMEKACFILHLMKRRRSVRLFRTEWCKSTTIRNLMGFIKPTSGKSSIFGLDCWNEAKIQRKLVICRVKFFIEGMNGLEFLKLMRNAWAKGYEKTR